MFNSLQGQVTFKGAEKIHLASGDLEWEILTSATTLSHLPGAENGARTRVYLHLYHREDQLKLYGFATPQERDLFLDLLKVMGIGPRQALRILSGIEVHQFVAALESEDLDTLAALPGLGKKTAQKILLSLRGKLSIAMPEGASQEGVSMEEELSQALAGMGFDRRVARKAVKASLREFKERNLPQEEMEREILRHAIGLISSQDRKS